MSDLSLEKKLLLLSQVYAGQLNTRIHVVKKTIEFPILEQYQV